MDTKNAYNHWSETYDTVVNKTRDLEAEAIRTVLNDVQASKVLELGCGTGKNTGWLAEKCTQLVAADFSRDMLEQAKRKLKQQHIQFVEADITKPWSFPPVNLITTSLVLEHVENLDFVFREAMSTLLPKGQMYICELHPYRQLRGSRAEFEKYGESVQLEYFIHHISDFISAATTVGLHLSVFNEWFDNNDRSQIPRLVSFLFQKN